MSEQALPQRPICEKRDAILTFSNRCDKRAKYACHVGDTIQLLCARHTKEWKAKRRPNESHLVFDIPEVGSE